MRIFLPVLLLACLPLSAMAETPDSCTAKGTVEYGAKIISTMGSGTFAPQYIHANRQGILSSNANAILDLKVEKRTDLSKRFNWGAGVEFAGGLNNAVEYQRYSPSDGWYGHDMHARRLMLQQLYAEVKWRGVFLTGGLKEQWSPLVNHNLSSGDLLFSGNAASMPEVRAGFVDFQNIPLTNRWLQIYGQISYGWYTDSDWWSTQTNRWNEHINRNQKQSYKFGYLRTRPDMPFMATVGGQCVTVFGGTARYYKHGEVYRVRDNGNRLRDYAEAFLPVKMGREGFLYGNTIGTWDLKLRYRFRSGDELSAYAQFPWEDGSGMGKMNGWDGLWGLEYKAPANGWVDGAVVEYIDLTNQSGPLHWDPADFPGSTLLPQATGADDYYNNVFYNAYAHYGQSIGSPFVKAPIFNTDGYVGYLYNRCRGFHAAVTGSPVTGLRYRVMAGYSKGYGNGFVSLYKPVDNFSMLLEVNYLIPRVKGLGVKVAFGLDHGRLLGNNSGAELTISYDGAFKF